MSQYPSSFPEEKQEELPGKEHKMTYQPVTIRKDYQGSGKLNNKVALITGGDSGIDRSIAVYFAREGADVSIVYLNEDKDAVETKKMVEQEGKKCLLIKGDIKQEEFCKASIEQTLDKFGKINILVNNAGMHYSKDSLPNISSGQFEETFRINIFSFFYYTREVPKTFE